MKLSNIRVSNFISFGEEPTNFSFEYITFLIGSNGTGKTAVLQALCRLFSFNPSLRRIKKSDFHVPQDETEPPEERELWIEADFIFNELADGEDSATIPPHFAHMRLDDDEDVPRVRFRLEASMGLDGDIDENLNYVLDLNENGDSLNTAKVARSERNSIQVHYLPARRDPSVHIAFSANALLGRLLRAASWDDERETIKTHTEQISECLSENTSIDVLSKTIQRSWQKFHKGDYFNDPKVTFASNEIEALLRHLSVSFTPGHDDTLVDFLRLSDGQKSMLYLSLVLSSQAIGRAALEGDDSFDIDKLRPPIFTLIAIEEPENSLSPYYLGRIVSALKEVTGKEDAQAIIATHAPSILRRIEPKQIRYLRLSDSRTSQVEHIQLPPIADEAHKFVIQAVKAFPEIYFSRLVVLGEGDSEEIVLPRLLEARGWPVDEASITVAPLGGRHVNHFWRLLEGLNIPYVTLLDLDVGRYQGGWGRVKYANDQLIKHCPEKQLKDGYEVIPKWNDPKQKITKFKNYLEKLKERGVFFSYPLDLDFSMITNFPEAYEIEDDDLTTPKASGLKSVLGKKGESSEYKDHELELFNSYHDLFKLGSKPAAHINALSNLTNEQLAQEMPLSLDNMIDAVIEKLEELPE
ncbi:chromosome segregation protein SMC [Candidatus Magnetomorum sp. HK-1]|nr:chromosome segregation protein SMC [Candidatus Magnetomorum sp. HK-1]